MSKQPLVKPMRTPARANAPPAAASSGVRTCLAGARAGHSASISSDG
jgi:hypothetical protein